MKVDRKQIWSMFGGKCAYCGCDLVNESGKYMQVDHVKALHRNWFSKGSLFPENDNQENLFPSCPKCNNYKHTLDVERFRFWVKNTPNVLLKTTAFNNALRFGMVEIKNLQIQSNLLYLYSG